jgi:hypothetical protein
MTFDFAYFSGAVTGIVVCVLLYRWLRKVRGRALCALGLHDWSEWYAGHESWYSRLRKRHCRRPGCVSFESEAIP